jgi:ArsR family transcriptional regulator
MAEQDVPVGEARETLERLYDNPEEEIPKLFEYRPDDETVETEYPVFQALAHEDRLRLLEALRHGERCGCELMVILNAPQSTVANHLRKLRDAGLVKNRKKGRWNYYRIADAAVMDLLDLAAIIYNE